MNKEILRTDIYYGHVMLYNQHVKTRPIVFVDMASGSTPYPSIGTDLYNDVEYPVIVSSFGAIYSLIGEKKSQKICITDFISLSALLSCVGFPRVLDNQAQMDIFKNVLNGKFCFEYCNLFGYQKKEYYRWENGLRVANVDIQSKSDYDISKYELVNRDNGLANYFKSLAEINPENPEESFTPLEEEGQIRKRILIEGRDKK